MRPHCATPSALSTGELTKSIHPSSERPAADHRPAACLSNCLECRTILLYNERCASANMESDMLTLFEKLETELNAQLGLEFGAHLQYLAIAAYFDRRDLDNLAEFF